MSQESQGNSLVWRIDLHQSASPSICRLSHGSEDGSIEALELLRIVPFPFQPLPCLSPLVEETREIDTCSVVGHRHVWGGFCVFT